MLRKSPVSLKIKRKLDSFEKELREVAVGGGLNLSKAYLQTIDAGGKRLRPALVFLCSQFNGGNKANILQAALAVEVIHAASLIHDDIMDGATMRRGKPTVYSKWGRKLALRVGDYLFAKAFLLLQETTNIEASYILAEAVKSLSQGEIEQIKSAYEMDQAKSYYYQKISLKTASLFKASAQLGAVFGGADEPEIKAVGQFAQNLGMVFQIYDDVLDVEAEEKLLGKSLGTDLKDGTLTLPIFFAAKESKSNRLAEIFTDKNSSESDVAEGLDIIINTKALEKTKKEAKKYVDKALCSLETIENDSLKNELRNICLYTVERYN